MALYQYPESADLSAIAPDLIIRATLDDPILRYVFPITRIQQAKMRWITEDIATGRMKLRGLDGEPTPVKMIGANEYEAEPGYFGEFMTLPESDMTLRASMLPPNITVPVDVTDLVRVRQDLLAYRQANQIRYLAWKLALTGVVDIPLPTGGTGGSGYRISYTPQTFTPTVPWSDLTNATPRKDLLSLQTLFGRGTSNMFNQSAVILMNSITVNYLLNNQNPNDLGGIRDPNGSTLNNMNSINQIFAGQGIPRVEVWDDSYYEDGADITDPEAASLWIEDGQFLAVASRPGGEKPGAFMWTRNINNPGYTSDPYAFVIDRTGNGGANRQVPPKIEVHQGFNGGPALKRARQLVVGTVAAP